MAGGNLDAACGFVLSNQNAGCRCRGNACINDIPAGRAQAAE
jgi:hypothetical protein